MASKTPAASAKATKLPPITRQQFRAAAKALPVTINGQPMHAMVKEFSTQSIGWNINGKMNVEIDGQIVAVQIGVNLTIVGSKDLPA